MIEVCGFIDLGFIGPKFTWTNNREDGVLNQERLDRVWENMKWQHQFPYSTVQHLARVF